MPSFAPRTEPIKKEEELLKRKQELLYAIKNNYAIEKLAKTVEKYRKAQLSLLKAKAHIIKERAVKKRLENIRIDTIESLIEIWKNKTIKEILYEFE